MKNINLKPCILALLIAFASLQGFAAFTPLVAEKAVAKKLEYSESLSRRDVEGFLGRKLTSLERMGFRVSKKKFVELVNVTTAQSSTAYGEPMNGLAIAAIITAFLLPPLGGLLGTIALRQIDRDGGRGRGLAMTAVIVSLAFTLAGLIVSIIQFSGY